MDTSRSVVDAVMPSSLIEALPLNGRNFLELALLVPGNAPAPNFDPTKIEHRHRSRRPASWGAAATSRSTARTTTTTWSAGRCRTCRRKPSRNSRSRRTGSRPNRADRRRRSSTSSPSPGATAARRRPRSSCRDERWQALPATYDASTGRHRRSIASRYAAAVGGPLARAAAFWFGAVEYRNQDGARARRHARRARRARSGDPSPPAPLNDLLGSARVDWRPNDDDDLSVRYAGERRGRYGGERARSRHRLGVAAAGQHATATSRSSRRGRGSRARRWSTRPAPRFSAFRNDDRSGAPAPQLTFPSIQDGSSFRVPQGTDAAALPALRHGHVRARRAHDPRRRRVAAGRRARSTSASSAQGAIEFVEDFASLRPQRRRPGRRQRPAVRRDAAQRQAGSGADAPRRATTTTSRCSCRTTGACARDLTLNLGLRYELDTDVKNISRYDEINPIVAPFLVGDRASATSNNFGPRIGFNWAPAAPRTSVHGGYGIYYDRVTLEIESLERGLDGRALPIEVRAGNVVLPRPCDRAASRRSRRRSANPFTGFHPARRRRVGHQHHRQPPAEPDGAAVQSRRAAASCRTTSVLRVDGVHNLGTHFIIGRTIGEVFNPVVGGPDRVVNLESSVNTHYDALLVSAEQRCGDAIRLPRVVHAGEGAELRQRRSDPVRERTNRPQRSAPRVRPDAERSAAPLHGRGRGSTRRADPACRRSGRSRPAVPMDILMPDGQSRVPAFERNAGGREFKTAAELNRALSRDQRQRRHRRRAAAAGRARTRRFGDGFSALDLRVSRPFMSGAAARRADARDVQRLQRDEHSRRLASATTPVSRTCWCATARSRRSRLSAFVEPSAGR